MSGDRRWLERQRRDRFVRRARDEGLRSRAAYKLDELVRRDRLLAPGRVVVDLGAAPGGWSAVAARAVAPAGRVVAVDLLPMAPLEHVRFIQGDCRSESVRGELEAVLEGRAVDLVLSDMAPNISGIAAMDQARSRELVELAAELAIRLLAPNGILLVKVFQGAELPGLRADLSARFRTVALRKPQASRAESSELYLLARGPGV